VTGKACVGEDSESSTEAVYANSACTSAWWRTTAASVCGPAAWPSHSDCSHSAANSRRVVCKRKCGANRCPHAEDRCGGTGLAAGGAPGVGPESHIVRQSLRAREGITRCALCGAGEGGSDRSQVQCLDNIRHERWLGLYAWT